MLSRPARPLRTGAAGIEHIGVKLEKVLTKSRQHPGMFFNKSMQWQAIKRSELLALTKKKACEAVKELVSKRGRRPRLKNKKNAWRPKPLGLKLPRRQTMFSFSFARAQPMFTVSLLQETNLPEPEKDNGRWELHGLQHLALLPRAHEVLRRARP